jgi:hypothetical protein
MATALQPQVSAGVEADGGVCAVYFFFDDEVAVGDLGKGDGIEVFVAGLGFGPLDMMGSWVFIYLFHVSLHETFHGLRSCGFHAEIGRVETFAQTNLTPCRMGYTIKAVDDFWSSQINLGWRWHYADINPKFAVERCDK